MLLMLFMVLVWFRLRERPTKQRKWKGSFHSTSKKNKAFFFFKKNKQKSVPGKRHRFKDGRVVFRKGLRVAETMTLEWIKYFWNSSNNSSITGQGSDPTGAGLLVPSGAKVPFIHPTGLSAKWARPHWLVLLSPFQSPPRSPSGPVGVCG